MAKRKTTARTSAGEPPQATPARSLAERDVDPAVLANSCDAQRGLEEDFLTAVRAEPADDGPRLAYADWLLMHGDWRGELIRVQCKLAARERNRRRPRTGPVLKELRARESELLARLKEIQPAWAARWPPPMSRGFATRLFVRDPATFLARAQEIRREHPVAEIFLADGSEIVASADGLRYAVLDTEHDSAGSIASSMSWTTTTVTVWGRNGKQIYSESSTCNVSESSSGYEWETGQVISAIALSADGRTLTLTLSKSGKVNRPL